MILHTESFRVPTVEDDGREFGTTYEIWMRDGRKLVTISQTDPSDKTESVLLDPEDIHRMSDMLRGH